MIDAVMQGAKTEVEHRLNLLEEYRQKGMRIQDDIERLSLELRGWEAYLKALSDERDRRRG